MEAQQPSLFPEEQPSNEPEGFAPFDSAEIAEAVARGGREYDPNPEPSEAARDQGHGPREPFDRKSKIRDTIKQLHAQSDRKAEELEEIKKKHEADLQRAINKPEAERMKDLAKLPAPPPKPRKDK